MLWGDFNVRGVFCIGFCRLGTFGAACSLTRGLFKLLMPKGKYDYYIIIPSEGCGEETTRAAYAARTKLNLIGDEEYGKVLVVDTGMDEAQKLSCLNVCRQTNGIYLITADELEELFK